MNQKIRENKFSIGSIVLAALIILGIDMEFVSLYSLEFNVTQYQQLLFSFLPILVYSIPLWILFKNYSKIKNVNIYLFIIAILGGTFIVGGNAGLFNGLADEFMLGLFPDSPFIYDWLDAIGAPIVEETLKLIVALLVLKAFAKKDLKSAFVTGAGVGLGFQIIEDISYIVNEASISLDSTFQQSLIRLSGAIASHWAMTAIFTTGFVYLMYYRKTSEFSMKRALKWILIPLLVHFLWNSPLTNYYEILAIILPTTLTLILLKQIKNIYLVIEYEEEEKHSKIEEVEYTSEITEYEYKKESSVETI